MSEYMQKCGNCSFFEKRETVVNALRVFGPEKLEVRTYCMWRPPIPDWAYMQYLPQNMTETTARRVDHDDGVYCRAFIARNGKSNQSTTGD